MCWAPLEVTPVPISKFHRGQRYQILQAYAQDGIMLSCIFKDLADVAFFGVLIEQLLQHCGREPESVLVMDNAFFHNPELMLDCCTWRLARLAALSIEELFAGLKGYIKRPDRHMEEIVGLKSSSGGSLKLAQDKTARRATFELRA